MEIKEVYENLTQKKDQVFFADKGLSMAEANHRADIVKEKALQVNAEFRNTGAYSETMDFNGKPTRLNSLLSIGLQELATKEGDLYALSAWLREAVSAKSSLLGWVRTASNQELLVGEEEFPVLLDQRPMPKLPPSVREIKELDALSILSVAERAEYLSVEARAAHLGKKIHVGGIIHTIREELLLNKNVSFKTMPDGNGHKTYVLTYEPMYEAEDVNKIFFKLQGDHRVFENRLNFLKSKIQNHVTTTNAALHKNHSAETSRLANEYKTELEAWTKIFHAHNTQLTLFTNMLAERRQKLTQFISGLKIIIPDSLIAINEEIRGETQSEKS